MTAASLKPFLSASFSLSSVFSLIIRRGQDEKIHFYGRMNLFLSKASRRRRLIALLPHLHFYFIANTKGGTEEEREMHWLEI